MLGLCPVVLASVRLRLIPLLHLSLWYQVQSILKLETAGITMVIAREVEGENRLIEAVREPPAPFQLHDEPAPDST